ncbi:MAG: hypothetical protein GYB15_01460 [Gammaproteobacteria bacterium]|nr:hypothetical protein [Gammaproteobacteria bacterium]
MTDLQIFFFISIVVLITGRTLLLRHISSFTSAGDAAIIMSGGTLFICLLFMPAAVLSGSLSIESLLSPAGVSAGMLKGFLLGGLLVGQQVLIGKSLSAIAYVFPLAVGIIAVVEVIIFSTSLSAGAIFGIGTLWVSGLFFVVTGHIGSMAAHDKLLFLGMVIAVVGFALCDKIGIPISGWYGHLFWTGVGSFLCTFMFQRSLPRASISLWILISLTWVVPELFFNFSLSGIIPVSYGYLAISLRIPILMIISSLYYKEGNMLTQMIFGAASLIGIIPIFWRTA